MSGNVVNPDRRLIMRGKHAVSAEFHEANKTFVFLMDDGSREVVSGAGEEPEEIETFIADVQEFVPLVRIGKGRSGSK